jgi:uncharacterized protein (TIGR00290 family)
MQKAFLNWSTGKDAAYSLFMMQQQSGLKIEKLLTTVNSLKDRVSMHGLRNDLLLEQVKRLGLPLQTIALPDDASMTAYNDKMKKAFLDLKAEGFTHSIYGDIFLEDLKKYREQQLKEVDLIPVFPLWKMNTSDLMRKFIAEGFKAITVSVNLQVLDRSFCGRIIDEDFIAELPVGVDPAGENGEYHSFVFDGPNFMEPIAFQKGEFIHKSFASTGNKDEDCFTDKQESWDTEFLYCDLAPI